MTSRRIDPSDVHEDRVDPPDLKLPPGLAFVDSSAWQNWTVKLEFRQSKTSYGTGFYINIPDTENDIILTAGHNLIDVNKQRSRDLIVMGEDIHVGDSFRISESYEQDPNPKNSVNDYGVIILPRNSKQPRPGFGFRLGFEGDPNDKVHVSGYRKNTRPGHPVTSSGDVKCNQEGQLEYKAMTEQGISGSPVWTAYNGHETVIAIHNHAPEGPGAGSRGTHLNFKVLRDVYRWANAGHESKALKVSHLNAHWRGFYLRFSEDIEFGRVRVGADNLETKFDVLPAYAPPTTKQKEIQPLYAFFFKQPPGWQEQREGQWVRWDLEKQRVTLTDKLCDSCLVRIVKGKNNTFRVVLARKERLMELRMQAKRIKSWEIELESGLETSEVSFEKHLGGKKLEFNDFCFE